MPYVCEGPTPSNLLLCIVLYCILTYSIQYQGTAFQGIYSRFNKYIYTFPILWQLDLILSSLYNFTRLYHFCPCWYFHQLN